MGDRKYHITGYREGILEGGEKLISFWYGNLEYVGEIPTSGWEFKNFYQEYNIKFWEFKNNTFKKGLSIIKSFEFPFEIKKIDIKDIEKIYNFYIEIENKKLSKLGYKLSDVPTFTIKTFEEIFKKGEIFAAIENDELIGVIIVSSEENDDLLKGKYGDILFLGIKEGKMGLGIESLLFSKVKEIYKGLPLRTTNYFGDTQNLLLFESLGFKKKLIRYEL